MQTFILIYFGQSSERGRTLTDATIDGSGLTELIKQTFAELELPPSMGGCVKVSQRQRNPDLFDLYFYSNMASGSYRAGGTYTAPDIAIFERTDFEDFAETEHASRLRLNEFARRLVGGELEAANFE